MYQGQKRYDRAESQLHAAFDALSSTEGADLKSIEAVVTQLADLYGTWDKPAKVAEWRAKLGKKAAPSR